MHIGIYDYDMYKGKLFIPNLQAMKVSSYYKSKGHIVKLLESKELNDDYDRLYFFRNKVNKYKHLSLWEKENSFCYGKQFTDFYLTLGEKMEKAYPDISLYAPFFRKQLLDAKMTESQIARYLKSIDFIQIYCVDYVYRPNKNHIVKPQCFLYDEYLPDTEEVNNTIMQMSKQYKTVNMLNKVLLQNEEQYWKIPLKTFPMVRQKSFHIPVQKNYSEYQDFLAKHIEQGQKKVPMIDWGCSDRLNCDDYFFAKEIVSTFNKGFYALSIGINPRFKYKANIIQNPYYSTCIKIDSYFNQDNTGKTFFNFLEPHRRKNLIPLINIPIYGPIIKRLINFQITKNQGGWIYNGR